MLLLALGIILEMAPDQPTGISQQIDAIPSWLLPLWANWPLVVLGVIGIGFLFITVLVMTRISVSIKAGIFGLTQKMATLGDQMGIHRQNTRDNFLDLSQKIDEMNLRIASLEEQGK